MEEVYPVQRRLLAEEAQGPIPEQEHEKIQERTPEQINETTQVPTSEAMQVVEVQTRHVRSHDWSLQIVLMPRTTTVTGR